MSQSVFISIQNIGLLISEIKIDNTFPTHQFFMSGNSNVYQWDLNDRGERIRLFAKDNLITFPINGFCLSQKKNKYFV